VTTEAEQIAGALAGFAVLLATVGCAIRAERARFQARLVTFLGGTGLAVPANDELARVSQESAQRRRRQRRLPRLGAQPRQLAQAGVAMTPGRFLVLQLVAGAVGLLLGQLLGSRFALDGRWLLLSVLAGGGVGLWLPHLLLQWCRGRRIRAAERQFPLAVDALASAIQAGQSLPQAIELLARDMPAPIGPEFAQFLREMAVGLPFDQALSALSERLGMRDVEIFVAAVQIQYRTGGNLSETLRGIANTIRERLRIRGEIQALTSQQRISAYIVSALPICIALALRVMSPAYFERLTEPGVMRILVVTGLLSLVAGFYVLRRIADIEL
jgi:tight adherence protein B